MNDDHTQFHCLEVVILEIKDILARYCEVYIKHTLRKTNSCAYFLAKKRLEQNMIEFFICKSSLSGIISSGG
jgi:hypothetical protein